MEDSCPATPLVLAGRDSKSPLQVALSSPESDGMKSPSRDSPDSRCVICLGRLQNKSFTDSCLHQFCFQCLLQWSKIKPECPLCKQPFKSIIHNVRSNLDYDQYHVEHGEPRYVLSDFMHSYNFDLIPVDRRFRYRSTMTREYFRELAESFLAHTRGLPEDTYQIRPRVPVDPAPAHNLRCSNRLRTSSLQQRSRQRGTSDFRRNIYTQDLWVQDLADISGRYRECTPQFYRENPAQIHRIIPWLNREVNVLLSDYESHAAYVLTRIISFLTQHSIRSREFRELVQPYFGDRTEHFIHELYTFARSVYDIAGFDQNAVYGTNPNYATEVQEISSSNEDSDIEVLETVKTAGKKPKKSTRQGGFKKILLKRTGDEASKSDEPVAGPSGINSAGPSEPIEICESDPDEIKVLDFVKPEPEVVTLSSGEDSPLLSGLDLSGGEYAETKPGKMGKCSPNDRTSDEAYVPPASRKRKNKHKMGKGKCKSNGFGLKGNQKRKYIKSRKRRSTSTSSTTSTSSSSSSESTASSTSTTSRSSGSSSRSRSKSYSSRSKRSRSISYVSCSSSEYKSSRKLKNKKSKVSRKKYKNKINRISLHKISENARRTSGSDSSSETEKTSVSKKKVKSCVIVPSWKSYDSSATASRSTFSCESTRSSDDSKYRKESLSLASYWSIASGSAAAEKCRKRRENSSERTSFKHKRKYWDSSTEEKSVKRVRDSASSSKSSCDVECVSGRKHLNGDYSKTSKKCRSDKSATVFNSENSNSENLSCGHGSDMPSTSTSSSSSNSSPSKLSSTIFYVNSD